MSSLIASDNGGGGGSYKPVPPGMHLGRCYRVIDTGTHKSEYKDTVKFQRKIIVQFEVHGEDESGNPLVTEKGEPLSISKNYTLSLGEKATLRIDLVSWRGRAFTPEELRGFELKNILGVWAMLTVSKSLGNNGKEYTNIVNVNPVPPQIKKMGLPDGHNKTALFSIDDPDMVLFESFSNNVKQKIEASPEWKAKTNSAPERQAPINQAPSAHDSGFDDMESDIPF